MTDECRQMQSEGVTLSDCKCGRSFRHLCATAAGCEGVTNVTDYIVFQGGATTVWGVVVSNVARTLAA
eukprot:1309207-Prymnesium_polylepis.2